MALLTSNTGLQYPGEALAMVAGKPGKAMADQGADTRLIQDYLDHRPPERPTHHALHRCQSGAA